MAASRYDTAGQANSGNTQTGFLAGGGSLSTTGSQTGNSNTQQQGTSNTTQSGTSNTRATTTQQTSTQNMTGSSLAALELLIQQLLGGGTQEMAAQRAQRQAEINNVSQTRAGYTKEAAFNDAQGLIAQTMRTTLESLLPGINRAAAGAGTSQNSMRALLTQRAAENAAQAASAQGLQAATAYGNINSSLSGVLANLTAPDNSTTNALLQALQTARGAVTNSSTTGTSNSTTNSDQTSNTNTSQNSNTNTNQQSNQTQSANGGRISNSGGGTTSGASNVDGLVYYGPQTSTLQMADSAARGSGTDIGTLLQLAGGGGGYEEQFKF